MSGERITALLWAVTVLVALCIVGAVGYLVHRHPRFIAPVTAMAAVAALLVTGLGIIVR